MIRLSCHQLAFLVQLRYWRSSPPHLIPCIITASNQYFRRPNTASTTWGSRVKELSRLAVGARVGAASLMLSSTAALLEASKAESPDRQDRGIRRTTVARPDGSIASEWTPEGGGGPLSPSPATSTAPTESSPISSAAAEKGAQAVVAGMGTVAAATSAQAAAAPATGAASPPDRGADTALGSSRRRPLRRLRSREGTVGGQTQAGRKVRRRESSSLRVLVEGEVFPGDPGGSQGFIMPEGKDSAPKGEGLKPVEPQQKRHRPCEKYNGMLSVLNWPSRRAACNAMADCIFVGRSITGACVERHSLEAMAAGEYEEEEEDEEVEDDEELAYFHSDDGSMVDAKLLQSLVATIRQEGAGQPMKILITGPLAEAMKDSLKDQHVMTKELAKELVLDTLDEEDATLALGSLLGTEALRAPTRRLVYWWVQQEYVKDMLHDVLKPQIDWVLVDNIWTQKNLAATFHWLLPAKFTVDALAPILAWTFSAEGPVEQPLLKVVNDAVPTLEEVTTRALADGIHYALDSEYVKTAARDTVKDLLLTRIEQMLKGDLESQESSADDHDHESKQELRKSQTEEPSSTEGEDVGAADQVLVERDVKEEPQQ